MLVGGDKRCTCAMSSGAGGDRSLGSRQSVCRCITDKPGCRLSIISLRPAIEPPHDLITTQLLAYMLIILNTLSFSNMLAVTFRVLIHCTLCGLLFHIEN